jgi:hypothetical protein
MALGNFFTSPKEWALYKDMTARAWRVAVFSSLGAMVFGYDAVWWSGILGMPSFTQRFGVLNPVTNTYSISPPLQSAGKSHHQQKASPGVARVVTDSMVLQEVASPPLPAFSDPS